MKEINKFGPVQAGFFPGDDFFNYKQGIYIHKEGFINPGHSVKIIGWGVENGTNYWLCVNSWNDDWGDNGTFKIIRGINHLDIESNIISGISIIRNKFFN